MIEKADWLMMMLMRDLASRLFGGAAAECVQMSVPPARSQSPSSPMRLDAYDDGLERRRSGSSGRTQNRTDSQSLPGMNITQSNRVLT
jgi:hypothetical protein